MSSIQKFINVTEKIMIVVTVLAFIPTSIYVFMPIDHHLSEAQIAGYRGAYEQIQTSFILGKRDDSNCTFREGLLNNDFCFRRANINRAIIKKDSYTHVKCIGEYYFDAEKIEVCAGTDEIIMNVVAVGTDGESMTLTHKDQSYPIFKISPPFNSPYVEFYHYVPNDERQKCQESARLLHLNIQERISNYLFKAYKDAMNYMWYFSILLIALLISMLIVNQCVNSVNLRPYAMVVFMIFNLAEISLIIYGMSFYTETKNIQESMATLSGCFVGKERENLRGIQERMQFGVNFGYTFFMGVVCVLLALMVIGELILKILQLRQYQLNENVNEGYELHHIPSSNF